jgi:prepilin-type N-terminal cleavage/methylation domain-containing protein
MSKRFVTNRNPEAGFTLVEMLVGMFVFALVSTGFYQVLLAQSRSVDVTRTTSRVGEEARVAFNRMVRDVRESDLFSAAAADGTSFTIKVNYNADGLYQNPNANGDMEILTFAYDATEDSLMLNDEELMSDVMPAPGKQMFEFTSNALEYDWGGDGTTTWLDVDQASCPSHGVTGVGNCNSILDDGEYRHLTGVAFALTDTDQTTDFFATAQLRNRT